MTTLPSSLVFVDALALGLAVSLFSVRDRIELARAVGNTTPEGKPSDLRAWADPSHQDLQVEALSPDGEAFLALVAQ